MVNIEQTASISVAIAAVFSTIDLIKRSIVRLLFHIPENTDHAEAVLETKGSRA